MDAGDYQNSTALSWSLPKAAGIAEPGEVVTLKIGIYNRDMHCGGGGEKKTCVLAEYFSRNHEVWIISGRDIDRSALESYFGVDLSRVRIFVPPRPILRTLRHAANVMPRAMQSLFRTEPLLENLDRLTETACYGAIQGLGLDVVINCGWASILPCPAPRGAYMCMFPHALQGAGNPNEHGSLANRIHFRVANRLLGMTPEVLDSYTVVTANSGFTSEWIERLWNVSAPVVYSSCDAMGPSAAKEKVILNVGRFYGFGRGDDKHQAEMLAAFSKLKSLHGDGWQLHFAGGVFPGRAAKKQAGQLLESARDLPVVFHFNSSFNELRDLYRRAAVYWHATGLGSSAIKNPEKQEHFGIATVEAMSAGAVPVVINTGGQREIVVHGENGFVWNNLDEMADYTMKVALDVDLRRQLSERAVTSSARFSCEAFARRVEQLLCLDRQAPRVSAASQGGAGTEAPLDSH